MFSNFQHGRLLKEVQDVGKNGMHAFSVYFVRLGVLMVDKVLRYTGFTFVMNTWQRYWNCMIHKSLF